MLSRNGYIMEQIKVASTHRNKTDWAILRVFYHKYLFTIKKYILLVFGCRGGGGGGGITSQWVHNRTDVCVRCEVWFPRNGSIIQIEPRGGYSSKMSTFVFSHELVKYQYISFDI